MQCILIICVVDWYLDHVRQHTFDNKYIPISPAILFLSILIALYVITRYYNNKPQ